MNDLNDFLLAFSDMPDEQENPEFDKVMEQYRLMFGCIPPLEMVPPGLSEAEIIEAVKNCIKRGKAELLQELGIFINENYLY